jgi:hypothetical protein
MSPLLFISPDIPGNPDHQRPKEPLFLRSLCLDKEFKESDVEVELHTPHLSKLDDDPGHWVNEWGFELLKKRN